MSLSIAVSGDSIVNRRVSVCDDPDFRALVERIREADVGFTHLEVNLLEYDDPNVYPAREAGGTWMRAPPEVAEELRWAGFDLVSHASNHALDYGYGGLDSTWAALDDAGVSYAGTGRDLADARLPTYREVSGARVALVSATTSFTPQSRAGESRRDLQGRPGVNPLGYHFEAGPEYRERIEDLATAMGYWVTPQDGTWLFNPPGLHNTVFRVDERDEPGLGRVLDESDRAGNLRAIAEGARQADVTVAHVHSHEWATDGSLADPPGFLRSFAHDAVDAGADVVVCQGSHTPLRGLERYQGQVIFYDPGDLFSMSDTTERLPADFFERYGGALDAPERATPGEGLAARGLGDLVGDDVDAADDSAYGGAAANPEGGYFSGAVLGTVVPVCGFDDDFALERVDLYPGTLRGEPTLYDGVPVRASEERAREIIEHVDDLSTAFDTDVDYRDRRGVVEFSRTNA